MVIVVAAAGNQLSEKTSVHLQYNGQTTAIPLEVYTVMRLESHGMNKPIRAKGYPWKSLEGAENHISAELKDLLHMFKLKINVFFHICSVLVGLH